MNFPEQFVYYIVYCVDYYNSTTHSYKYFKTYYDMDNIEENKEALNEFFRPLNKSQRRRTTILSWKKLKQKTSNIVINGD